VFPFFIAGNSGPAGPLPGSSQQLKTLQIVRAAVIAGPLFFLPIALLLNSKPLNFEIGVLEIVGLLMVGSIGMVYMLIGQLNLPKNVDALRAMPPEEQANALAGTVVKNEIIKGALLEGPTFFSFILILINGSLVGLVLGLLLTCVSAAVFPTKNRFQNQVDALKFNLGL